LQTKLTKILNPLQSFQNILFSNKTLIGVTSAFLIIFGTIKEPMFALLPIFYLICIGSAYKLGSKIEDYAINAAYNWSIKWAIFIAFLYISAVYLNNAFVFAMFLLILVNITLRPTFFITKNKLKT
tara:strand:+ start:146 stop:523 length:378 start_codon:yes stop_codon:yes gene_type:complete